MCEPELKWGLFTISVVLSCSRFWIHKITPLDNSCTAYLIIHSQLQCFIMDKQVTNKYIFFSANCIKQSSFHVVCLFTETLSNLFHMREEKMCKLIHLIISNIYCMCNKCYYLAWKFNHCISTYHLLFWSVEVFRCNHWKLHKMAAGAIVKLFCTCCNSKSKWMWAGVWPKDMDFFHITGFHFISQML